MSDPPVIDSLGKRRLMVDGQIRTFGVTDLGLIDRFLSVPRENFVEKRQLALAWSDAPLQLSGLPPRTLLTPMVLAKMLQAAMVRPSDRVLDVAPGLGYSTAILAGLAGHVVALESFAERAAAITRNCAELSLSNVSALAGPLQNGAPAHGPFNVILIHGAVEHGMDALVSQLADGGRMVVIRSRPGNVVAEVVRMERHGMVLGERTVFETSACVLEGFDADLAFAL